MLRIAIPNKGTLSNAAVEIIREAGYRCTRTGRELSITDTANGIEFDFLRPRDIPVYVSQGVIDVGITGRDLNLNADSPAVEIMALGFGKSTFHYAVPNTSDITVDSLEGLRIACSYANIVKRDVEKRGASAKVIEVDGAVELTIRLGVADVIADVVDSGQTLREAGLKIIGEPIMSSEAVVIARSEEATNKPNINTFLKRLNGIVLAREYAMIEYDIERKLIDKATVITPGIEAPTISPLNDPAWVAIKAMTKKKGLNDIIDALADLGATGIVVTDIRTCRL
jgi:ATP phosphoribosyltransferase